MSNPPGYDCQTEGHEFNGSLYCIHCGKDMDNTVAAMAEDEQAHWEEDADYMALYFPPDDERG